MSVSLAEPTSVLPTRRVRDPRRPADTRPPAAPGVRRVPRPGRPESADAFRTALAAGDPATWQELLLRHRPMVEAVARRVVRCPADVDEVAQRTFVALWSHADRIVDVDRLPGWLATTARREALALVTATREVPTEEPEGSDACTADPAYESLLTEELRSALHNAIMTLPPHQRRVVRALLSGEESYDEIARVHGIPRGSIGPTRARAVAALRAALLPAFG